MISGLPPDIIHEIGRWLPQHDLLHLALTCKTIYQIVHEHLYSSVIIDSSKHVYRDHDLTKLYSSLIYKVEGALEPVVIRSLYALTQFLKTLIAHPQYARLIRVFVARPNIPDMPGWELDSMLRKIFPTLSNVRVLDWYSMSCGLHAEIISLLPNTGRLRSLCGNFHAFSSAKGVFDFLVHLNISNMGHNSQPIDMAAFPSIESLCLSKTPSAGKFPGDCCRNKIQHNTISQMSILKQCQFSPFFRLQLRSLALKDLCLKPEDARHILTGLDLHNLEHLSLDNCFENVFDDDYATENTVRIVRRTAPSSTFLDILLEGAKDIRSLNLGITNELLCNSASLRTIKNMRALAKLSIHIKTFCARSSVSLAPLISAVQQHKESLRYLSVCINSVNADRSPACSRSRKYYDLASISGLENLTHLQVLCLPITYSQSLRLPGVLGRLQSLKLVSLEITDPGSVSLCTQCHYLPAANLCNATSLVSQDYLDQFALATGSSQSNDQQYLELAELYGLSFSNLSFVRFEADSRCKFYRFDSLKSAVLFEELSDEYEVLVNKIVE